MRGASDHDRLLEAGSLEPKLKPEMVQGELGSLSHSRSITLPTPAALPAVILQESQ